MLKIINLGQTKNGKAQFHYKNAYETIEASSRLVRTTVTHGITCFKFSTELNYVSCMGAL